MDKSIIILYDPFTMNSKVFVDQGNYQEQSKIPSDLNKLANSILELAYKKDIFNIKLNAPLAFVNELCNNIKEKEQLTYNKTKLKIEVI